MQATLSVMFCLPGFKIRGICIRTTLTLQQRKETEEPAKWPQGDDLKETLKVAHLFKKSLYQIKRNLWGQNIQVQCDVLDWTLGQINYSNGLV